VHGNIDEVPTARALIAAGSPIDYISPKNRSAFIFASLNHKPSIVVALMEKNVTIPESSYSFVLSHDITTCDHNMRTIIELYRYYQATPFLPRPLFNIVLNYFNGPYPGDIQPLPPYDPNEVA
jgi:hypothetical protein